MASVLRSTATEFGTILLFAVLLATGTWMVHPERPRWEAPEPKLAYEISILGAEAFDDIVWVDARAAFDFEDEHIPGAFNLNLNNWDEQIGEFLFNAWDPDAAIIVYCEGGDCHTSKEIAERLATEQPGPVYFYLKGGYPEWKRENRY